MHQRVTGHECFPREVAELLGVTRPAVQGRIHRGTLPAVENGGGSWFVGIHPEQVEAARAGAHDAPPLVGRTGPLAGAAGSQRSSWGTGDS